MLESHLYCAILCLVIYSLSGCAVFLLIICIAKVKFFRNDYICWEKCFHIPYNFIWIFPQPNNKAVRCYKLMQVIHSVRYFCSILNKIEFFRPILLKITNIKFKLKSVKRQPGSSTRTHWRQVDRRTTRIFAEKLKTMNGASVLTKAIHE